MAHVAKAADDGQTQPKVNVNGTTSSSTPVDIIATTNGSGNVKGVSCILGLDGSGNSSPARVKFTVNGGAVQTIDLYGIQPSWDDGSGNTGWVPFNVRFSSSIRVQVQKMVPAGSAVDCTVSWGLD